MQEVRALSDNFREQIRDIERRKHEQLKRDALWRQQREAERVRLSAKDVEMLQATQALLQEQGGSKEAKQVY